MRIRQVQGAINNVLAAVVSLIMFIPIYLVIVNSLKTKAEASSMGAGLPSALQWENFVTVIEKGKLAENARVVGAHLLTRLQELVAEFPALFSNPRGLGLFAAFDVVTPEKRTEIREAAFDLGLIILPSGERSIRFRPPLNVSREEIDLGIEIIRKTWQKMSPRAQEFALAGKIKLPEALVPLILKAVQG